MSRNAINIILLADTNSENRCASANYLRSAGYEIWEASNAAEALTLVQKNPSLIVLAIELPDMSGFDVCTRIKNDPKTCHIPVLHTAPASLQSRDRIRGLEGGAEGYLIAPIEPEELAATIRALLRTRAAETTASRLAVQGESKSLDTFCYTIAHDLKSPLRSIKGFTNILREEYASHFDEAGQDYTKRIVDSVERMNRLIDDLLDYGRLGNMELPLQTLNLEDEIQFVLHELWADAKVRNAKISITKPLHAVHGNPTVIKQVFSNLLSNAIKFVEPGLRPEIRISSELVDSAVRISIQDNGIGIEPSCFKRIFDVFERLHGKDSGYPGTGIGLAIVRKGVERMGGSVGVESGPGKGSRFWVQLPPATTEQTR